MATLIGGVVLIAALLWWELRAKHPMMPLRFFKIPAFSAGNTVAFSVSLGMFATTNPDVNCAGYVHEMLEHPTKIVEHPSATVHGATPAAHTEPAK